MAKVEDKNVTETINNRLMGKLEAYVLGDNFDDYLFLVNNFFHLNGLKDDKLKVRLLINQIGGTASNKIIKAVKPQTIEELNYADLLKICKSIFMVERNTIVEHFKFNMRQQNEGESLSDFALELQDLAQHCAFEKFYDTALRDKFIAGIRSKETKKVLLTLSGKKKFAEVVEDAKREELVRQASGKMQFGESSGVNRVAFSNQNQNGRKRGRSQSRNRNTQNKERSKSKESEQKPDWRKSAECYNCHRTGHIAKQCRAKVNSNRAEGNKEKTTPNTNALAENLGHMDIDDNSGFMEQVNRVLGVSKNENLIQIVSLKLNQAQIKFEVDTGSRFTVMSFSDFLKYFPNCKLMNFDLPLSVVSGDRLQVKGKFLISLKTHEKM